MNNDGYLFLALKLKASFPKSLTMQAPALVYKVMKFDSHADEQLCTFFTCIEILRASLGISFS